MSKKFEFINKVRICSFIICFASGGSLILAHFKYLGFNRILTDELWQVLETVSGFSAVTGIATTFIISINSTSNGLDNLRKNKEAKRNKKVANFLKSNRYSSLERVSFSTHQQGRSNIIARTSAAADSLIGKQHRE